MTGVRRTSVEEFAGMRDEWNALHARAHGGPMLTWEWAFSWWEAYQAAGVRREFRLMSVRDDTGTLIGLAPFVLRPWRQYGVTLRRLEFMGTGEVERDETCSEFLDVLAADGAEAVVAEAVADCVAADGGWDETVCRDVRRDAPAVVDLLRSRLVERGHGRAEEFGAARCPCVRLPETWPAYLGALSRNSRRMVRYKRKQLEAMPGVQFRCAEAPEEVAKAFPEFARLHQQRWAGDDRPGCFGSAVFADFMGRLTPRLAAAGGVRIASLMIEGRTAAAYYLLCHGGAVYYYNSGVALQAHGDLSPGSVCLGYVIEDAIRRGEKEFHFFKGGPDSYKWHWTDQAVPVASICVQRPGWKRAVAAGGGRLAGWVRSARRALARAGARKTAEPAAEAAA